MMMFVVESVCADNRTGVGIVWCVCDNMMCNVWVCNIVIICEL